MEFYRQHEFSLEFRDAEFANNYKWKMMIKNESLTKYLFNCFEQSNFSLHSNLQNLWNVFENKSVPFELVIVGWDIRILNIANFITNSKNRVLGRLILFSLSNFLYLTKHIAKRYDVSIVYLTWEWSFNPDL